VFPFLKTIVSKGLPHRVLGAGQDLLLEGGVFHFRFMERRGYPDSASFLLGSIIYQDRSEVRVLNGQLFSNLPNL
jgi:hypothetical protein